PETLPAAVPGVVARFPKEVAPREDQTVVPPLPSPLPGPSVPAALVPAPVHPFKLVRPPTAAGPRDAVHPAPWASLSRGGATPGATHAAARPGKAAALRPAPAVAPAAPTGAATAKAAVAPAQAAQIEENYGRLPLSFEANYGQADAQVQFLARGPGYQLFLTGREAVFVTTPAPQADPT